MVIIASLLLYSLMLVHVGGTKQQANGSDGRVARNLHDTACEER